MFRRFPSTVALVVVLLPVGGARAQQVDPAAADQLTARINAMRNVQGLRPLVRHPALDEAARVHSLDMAARGELSHRSPSTGDPAARVRTAGVRVLRLAENVARGGNPDEAHQSLIASDPHRAHLLDGRMTHLGISVVAAGGRAWLTQLVAALPVEEPVELGEPWSAEEEVRAGAAGDTAGSEQPEERAPAAEPAPTPPAAAEDGEAPTPPRPRAGTPPAAGATAPPAPGHAAPQAAAPTVPPPEVAPRVQPPLPGRRMPAGYWVWWSDRWWWYPVPPGARPGQVLEPDLRVEAPVGRAALGRVPGVQGRAASQPAR